MQTHQLTSTEATLSLGKKIGESLQGGEVIELIGDVGAGKTTLVKGIAQGLGVKEVVQSPSFTISSHYSARDDIRLHHYDFYRLQDPGLMGYDLIESLEGEGVVTIVEWAQTVENILPPKRKTIRITPVSEETRTIEISEVA